MILFIFADETNETGDASSATSSVTPKPRDWASQVESAEQQEAENDAENLSQTNSLPRENRGRPYRGQRRRNTSQLLFTYQRVIAINTSALFLTFSQSSSYSLA